MPPLLGGGQSGDGRSNRGRTAAGPTSGCGGNGADRAACGAAGEPGGCQAGDPGARHARAWRGRERLPCSTRRWPSTPPHGGRADGASASCDDASCDGAPCKRNPRRRAWMRSTACFTGLAAEAWHAALTAWRPACARSAWPRAAKPGGRRRRPRRVSTYPRSRNRSLQVRTHDATPAYPRMKESWKSRARVRDMPSTAARRLTPMP